MKTNAVIVGHSHTNALGAALKRREAAGNSDPDACFRVFHLKSFTTENGLKEAELLNPGPDNQITFGPLALKAMDALFPQGTTHTGISVIGGNAHLILGLLRHPEPFDFLLHERPNLPLDATARLLPFEVIFATLKARVTHQLDLLSALRLSLPGPVFHIESPPPMGDDEHVSAHLDPYFRNENFGKILSPRELRYKLWRVHSAIFAERCAEIGATFISVPPGTTDDEGFMVSQAYAMDATHANEWYGDQVIDHIRPIVAQALSE
jgi:hypothetical protein